MKNISYSNSAQIKSFEQGVYLVLMALFIFVLVSLCALVMGLGFVSTGKARLQVIVNIASVGALEAFMRASGTLESRMDEATARANQLIAVNSKMPGISQEFEAISTQPSDAGVVDFGTWYAVAPNSGDPCSGEYPCFKPEDFLNGTANAVRINLNTTPSNSLLAPFAQIFGQQHVGVRATGLATLVQRCTAYLMDSSLSVTEETHLADGVSCITYSNIPNPYVPGTYYTPGCSDGSAPDPMPETCETAECRVNPAGLGCRSCYSHPNKDDNGDGIKDCWFYEGQLINGTGGSSGFGVDDAVCPPAIKYKNPQPGLFAYRTSKIPPPPPDTPFAPRMPIVQAAKRYMFTPSECFWDLNRLSNDLNNRDFLNWCNLEVTRGNLLPSGQVHAREDYYLRDANLNPSNPGLMTQFRVDNFYRQDSLGYYLGPQPLSRFFLAFNAGLRTVEQLRSPGDKAMVYVFQGDKVDSEPAQSNQLTEDLTFLIKLTNFARRGLYNHNTTQIPGYPEIVPNAVSRGWFPRTGGIGDVSQPGTNIIKAIRDALDALNTCPVSASKAIIMASDGIPTCTFGTAADPSTGFYPQQSSVVDCAGDYLNTYLPAKKMLLTEVVDALQASEVSFTMLLDSAKSGPNMRNVEMQGLGWLTPEMAFGLESPYCGIPDPYPPHDWDCNRGSFFDISPAVDNGYASWNCESGGNPEACTENHYAFINGASPGVVLREPLGIFFQLAQQTGGIVCPIMPLCDGFISPPQGYSSWYFNHDAASDPEGLTPEVLRPDIRVQLGPVLRCSPVRLTKAEQNIACVLGALGGNPYQNVAELD